VRFFRKKGKKKTKKSAPRLLEPHPSPPGPHALTEPKMYHPAVRNGSPFALLCLCDRHGRPSLRARGKATGTC
jgi:hypothetical protein